MSGGARTGHDASCPGGYERDDAVSPRIEVALVECAGDAGPRFAKRRLAAMPGAHLRTGTGQLGAVTLVRVGRLVPVRPGRAPELAHDRAVVEMPFANETVGARSHGGGLRSDVH